MYEVFDRYFFVSMLCTTPLSKAQEMELFSLSTVKSCANSRPSRTSRGKEITRDESQA